MRCLFYFCNGYPVIWNEDIASIFESSVQKKQRSLQGLSALHGLLSPLRKGFGYKRIMPVSRKDTSLSGGLFATAGPRLDAGGAMTTRLENAFISRLGTKSAMSCLNCDRLRNIIFSPGAQSWKPLTRIPPKNFLNTTARIGMASAIARRWPPSAWSASRSISTPLKGSRIGSCAETAASSSPVTNAAPAAPPSTVVTRKTQLARIAG